MRVPKFFRRRTSREVAKDRGKGQLQEVDHLEVPAEDQNLQQDE